LHVLDALAIAEDLSSALEAFFIFSRGWYCWTSMGVWATDLFGI